LDELAGGDHCGVADEGDELALASRFDAEHAEAVVGVVECDAVYHTGQDLSRDGACLRCFPHQLMMEIELLARYRDHADDGKCRTRPGQLVSSWQ